MKLLLLVSKLISITAMLVMTIALLACDSTNPPARSAQTQPTQVQSKPQSQATPTYTTPTLVRRADFGAWSYAAQRMGNDTITPLGGKQINPGDVFAKVSYKYDTADDVRRYAEANRSGLQKVRDVGGQAEVFITFRTYVQSDQFRTFVKTYGLQEPWSAVRTITDPTVPNGYGSIMGVHPVGNDPDPLPASTIDDYLNAAGHPTLKGVFFTRAWVDAKELSAIASDPSVYFVDITPDLVRMDLAANGVENADKVDVEVEPNTPFHTMELAGLDLFK